MNNYSPQETKRVSTKRSTTDSLFDSEDDNSICSISSAVNCSSVTKRRKIEKNNCSPSTDVLESNGGITSGGNNVEQQPPFIIDLFENSQLSQVQSFENPPVLDLTYSQPQSTVNDDLDSSSCTSSSSSTDTSKNDPQWDCPKCTYKNDSKTFACTMCGTTMAEAATRASEREENMRTPYHYDYSASPTHYVSFPSSMLLALPNHISSTSSSAPAIVTPSTPHQSLKNKESLHTSYRTASKAARALIFDNEDDGDENESECTPLVDEDIDDHFSYSVVRDDDNNKWYDAVLNQCKITENSNRSQ